MLKAGTKVKIKQNIYHKFVGKEGFECVMETQQTRMAISRAEALASLVSPRMQGFISRVFGGGRR